MDDPQTAFSSRDVSHVKGAACCQAAAIAFLIAALLGGATAPAAEPPLVLESKIPLGAVNGRIDHLAVDVGGERLFVAELGNDSVGVVDLKAGRLLQTLGGLAEPQGVGYVAALDTLVVASAGDGSLRAFTGAELQPAWRLDFGDDADNIRVDAGAGLVFMGYGGGAIAVIDPRRRAKLAEIALKAHPEAFVLEPGGQRLFVNVPSAREIAIIDRAQGRQVAAWPVRDAAQNFPIAFDAAARRVLTVFRQPPRLAAYAEDGTALAKVATCGDADDVFVDARRGRVYVSCGEGAVDVFERRDAGYDRIGRIATMTGARTSLFVPELDRLYLAVRATAAAPAAIWVLRPAP